MTGTFDGTSFTPTEVVGTDAFDWPDDVDPMDDVGPFTTPCPTPAGGWRPVDPSRTDPYAQQAAYVLSQSLRGYASSWVDPKLQVLDVRVTDNLRRAERRLRAVYGGPICVTQAAHSQAEIEEVLHDLMGLPGWLMTSSRHNLENDQALDRGHLRRRVVPGGGRTRRTARAWSSSAQRWWTQ